MEELAVSGVDAHMGNAAGGTGLEEHQIARLQSGLINGRTHAVLIHRGAVGGEAQLLQHIIGISGAVKAAGGSAAGAVGGADVLLGFRQNLRAGYGNGHRAGRAGKGRAAGQGSAERFAAPKIFGRIGGIGIFVGNFRQFHKITANIADFFLVKNLEPAFVYTDDVAFFTGIGHSHNAVGCGRTGAQVDALAGDRAIAQLGIFLRVHGKVVREHVAGLKVVVDLIPVALLFQNGDALAANGGVENRGLGVRACAQIQRGCADKTNAVHLSAGSGCVHGDAACRQNNCQRQGENVANDLHTFPPSGVKCSV